MKIKREHIKLALQLSVGVGVGIIVGTGVANLVKLENMKLVPKVLVTLGTVGLGGAAQMATDKFVAETVDNVADLINTFDVNWTVIDPEDV